ncbi:MAG: phosphoglucosamine mutase [Chitinophagaceae bacterium]|nr:phosphoglucosamine mutase [Chitinophagaceae bacterium]
MSLIKSISGIRGTIGGKVGYALTPVDIVKYVSAYAQWLSSLKNTPVVVIGRDARISGEIISALVASTLRSMGIDIIDIGLSTTPTVEMIVMKEKAGGGIIITASHNPIEWNALKFLNQNGEFISSQDGETILQIAEKESFQYASTHTLGKYTFVEKALEYHIESILSLPMVEKEAITQAKFKIVIDAVNSTGGIAVPMLLEKLGVKEIKKINCTPDGHFSHNPEPLPENISQLISEMKNEKYELGIAVDPDVDRLAFVCGNGEPFGEEYTLVAVADYVLQKTHGNTVSNLSSTRALQDITEKHGGKYFPSAVGEVNVVEKMKECNAVIGGEGNGGIILPQLHYGRDALVGIALFLSYLASSKQNAFIIRRKYPSYYISKNKIEIDNAINIDNILAEIQKKYKQNPQNTIDGLRIEFGKDWVHLRKSNTEPIIRIYAESQSQSIAQNMTHKFVIDINEILSSSYTKL